MTIEEYKNENEKLIRLFNDVSKENERLRNELKICHENITNLIRALNKIMEDY